MKKQISNYIDSYKDEMLSQLSEFIAIPSESDNPEELSVAIDFVLNLSENLGLSAQTYCENQVVVTEIGSGDETLGILSHLDVVPAGDLD